MAGQRPIVRVRDAAHLAGWFGRLPTMTELGTIPARWPNAQLHASTAALDSGALSKKQSGGQPLGCRGRAPLVGAPAASLVHSAVHLAQVALCF